MKFVTTDDTLTVILSRREQLASMKAKITVQKSQIRSLRFQEIFREWHRWEVRLPGTYVPRLLIAGSFWTENGWDFIYARQPRGGLSPILMNVLVLEMDGHERYKRLIISATEPEVQKLQKWYKK